MTGGPRRALLPKTAARVAAGIGALVLLTGCSLADSALDNAGKLAVGAVESSLDQAGIRGVAEGVSTSANARLMIEQASPAENFLTDAMKDLGWQGNGSKLLGRYPAIVKGNSATIGEPGACVIVAPDNQDASYVVRDCPQE